MTKIDEIFSQLETLKADYVLVHFYKEDGKLIFNTSIQNDEHLFSDDDHPPAAQTSLENIVRDSIRPFIDTLDCGHYQFFYNTRKITSSIELINE